VEIGVYTFADLGGLTPGRRFANLLEEADLADQVGLDVFGVGEHHRPEYAVSAPAVALAAIAGRTSRIRLTSAVTVLSSDDPIRVLQQFAELDLVSGGRAEIMAGRGSFIESFPLFGYDLSQYDELFATKLRRLLQLREDPAAHGVFPVPVQRPLPVWVAVGGNPESAARAGTLGLPMALAIIGGMPERFVPFAELHRRAGGPALGINSHGYVGDPDDFFPAYAEVMTAIGRERGWPPTTRQDFDALRTRRGALLVGSVDEVVEKILFQHELFGHDRFLMQTSLGRMPHDRVLRSIELLAEVRERVTRTIG
jgi:alkanesulfonate monooxygenase SsuD/methylene tetrahydromethanopterin reductase-like flavin-dependent oxidoreductase (luciferase family)